MILITVITLIMIFSIICFINSFNPTMDRDRIFLGTVSLILAAVLFFTFPAKPSTAETPNYQSLVNTSGIVVAIDGMSIVESSVAEYCASASGILYVTKCYNLPGIELSTTYSFIKPINN